MALITEKVTHENFDKICRLCLKTKEAVYISTMYVYFQDSPVKPQPISNLMRKVLKDEYFESESVQDFEPKIICTDCFNELKVAYLFILKYEEANAILKQFIVSHVKVEEAKVELEENTVIEPNATASIPAKQIRTRTQVKLVKNHKNATLYPCPICTEQFSALELREHVHSHKTFKKYLSIPQEYKISPRAKFISSGPSKNICLFNRKIKLHKCPFCNVEFTADAFWTHVDNHKNEAEFKCDKCDRVFRLSHHLAIHRVQHLKEFPFKCEHCQKGFVVKSNYDCHILTHTHNINELPHGCQYCDRRFANPLHLSRHQIIHTEKISYADKYKVCKCVTCKRSFKDKNEMDAHKCVPLKKRAKDGVFPCRSCDKVFKTASAVYYHNRTRHSNSQTKTLCAICGAYVINYYEHKLSHEGHKPFKCEQCGKSFRARNLLKKHSMVHTGEKPYICSACGKGFSDLYNLQVHERMHKGDKCHKCMICDKGFLEKSYLKKHMAVHSKV